MWPKNRLERSRWRGGHCQSVEQPAAVAEVRLGHKEGGSCDPFTQEDAGRTPAAQLFRGYDSGLSASSGTYKQYSTRWRVYNSPAPARQAAAITGKKLNDAACRGNG